MRLQLSLLAVAGLAIVTSAHRGFLSQSDEALDTMFNLYMARMGKSYSTKEEYLRRRDLFEAQVRTIQEHNARNDATFVMALNKFSDLTTEEFESMFLGDSQEPEEYVLDTVQEPQLKQVQVSPIDWRDKNVVGPVKNQGKCGSCWSFSTVGPIEEHYAIKYGQQLVFAEQQLVDCSGPYGNNGCNGGLFANGYGYVKQFGLMLNSSYPYIANDTINGGCLYDESQVAVRISGTVSAIRSPQGLKEALMNGPASISLHASADSFRQYKSGIYNDANCPTAVNHAVQTVGWGTENGINYFIVRNSWGPTWGDQGYIRIAEATTDLGICGMLYRVPMQPVIV